MAQRKLAKAWGSRVLSATAQFLYNSLMGLDDPGRLPSVKPDLKDQRPAHHHLVSQFVILTELTKCCHDTGGST